ncbi:MAG TPA: alpha-amylase family glycosyl hydrolase [Egibacteraceae bacterium]|nr:alpha-amylase family glycosyl hydrolase [Egibacteraceae bacterium]
MRAWWRNSVGYEIYIRSFADSDGDGVGDLPGVLERLDYLAWLGVDVIWITPFYPSPMHDHGYDVADYRGVADVFGTLDDFDALVAKAHGLGMRALVDLVPNHTSSEHAWFQAARSSRDDPHRDFYIWRDPRADGGPPNNWRAQFGGSAWTLDEATGQYWLHLFLPEQPDLNWANPAVADAFDEILRFWLERGADGFRIDVAHSLVKHPDLLDNPPVEAAAVIADDGPEPPPPQLQRVYDIDQPGVLDVFRRWRGVVAPFDGLLLGEVYLLDADRVAPYVAGDGLHLSFWFKPLHIRWDPDEIQAALAGAASVGGDGLAWVQSSHDRPRAVSRYGGGQRGRERALAMAALQMFLPGVPFIYQGEELGLENGVVPDEFTADPQATRGAGESRDVARTPMPWAPSPGLGFTAAEQAWLPFGDRRPEDTVAVQRDDPQSMLHRFRRLIALRRSDEDLSGAGVEWLGDGGPVVAYRRGPLIVAANCGERSSGLHLPEGRWTVEFASLLDREGEAVGGELALAPREAVVLRG